MGTCIILADINTQDLFDLDFVINRKVNEYCEKSIKKLFFFVISVQDMRSVNHKIKPLSCPKENFDNAY